SSCRSPELLASLNPHPVIGRSRRSRGFSVWLFFFSEFPQQCLDAGSNELDHARRCLPLLFVSAAGLSFPLLAFGGTNFGSSISVTESLAVAVSDSVTFRRFRLW